MPAGQLEAALIAALFSLLQLKKDQRYSAELTTKSK